MAVCVAGCGSGIKEFPTAAVSGKITLNGAAVTDGRVFYYPVKNPGNNSSESGKFAQGTIESDGSYELSTYGNGDGAVVGEHRVTVMPTKRGDGEARPIGAYMNTVTVNADQDNSIDIDLTIAKPQGDEEQDEDD